MKNIKFGVVKELRRQIILSQNFDNFIVRRGLSSAASPKLRYIMRDILNMYPLLMYFMFPDKCF